MRKLLLLFAFLCAVPVMAQNPTLVQGGSYQRSTTTTVSFSTANGQNTTGNQLIAYAYCSNTATLTIADVNTGGSPNTWVPIVSNEAVPAGGVRSLWIAYSAQVAPTLDTATVTANTACTNGLTGIAMEFNNLTNAGFDKGPASTAGLTSGSVTPSNNIELVVGILAGGGTSLNAVAGTGYTLIGANDTGSFQAAIEYKVVTTCGAQTASFTTVTGTNLTGILTFTGTASSTCAAGNPSGTVGGSGTSGGNGTIGKK